jgi:DNA-binding CsgD family transcriptional regulator
VADAGNVGRRLVRADVERRIEDFLRADTPPGAVLVGEPGSGRTQLLRCAAEKAAAGTPAYTVHWLSGSPALKGVPYSALAPFLVGIATADLASPASLARETRRQLAHAVLDEMHTQPGPVLLVIDDADDLDPASAAVIAELLEHRQLRLLATARGYPEQGSPAIGIPPEWHELKANNTIGRIDIPALTPDEMEQLCRLLLEGLMVRSQTDIVWQLCRGNLALAHALLEDSRSNGTLVRQDGTWVVGTARRRHWPHSMAAVRHALDRLDQEAQEAATLIAMAEPVETAAAAAVAGDDVVRQLREAGVVTEDDAGLRLRYPVAGEAIRLMTPVTESLRLRPKVLALLEAEPDSSQGLQRLVAWSLTCGIELPEEQLVRAGIAASNVAGLNLAEKAAAGIVSEENRVIARLIKARVSYHRGDTETAAQLIDGAIEEAPNVHTVQFAAALAPAIRVCRPRPCSALEEDARKVRQAAIRLLGPENRVPEHRAREHRAPDNHPASNHHPPKYPALADAAQAHSDLARAAELLELMALGCRGQYTEMGRRLKEAAGLQAARTQDRSLHITLLVMEAEYLTTVGRPESAAARTSQALELMNRYPDELLFHAEAVLRRHLLALLQAGHWAEVPDLLQDYARHTPYGLAYFGPAVDVMIAWMQARVGDMRRVLQVLEPVLPALDRVDNQRMRGLARALKAFALARLKDPGVEEALAQYEEVRRRGRGFITMIAEAYAACARRMAGLPDDGVLAQYAQVAAEAGMKAAETEILALAAAVAADVPAAEGPEARQQGLKRQAALLSRLSEVAGACEGTTAGAISCFAQALLTRRPKDLTNASARLSEAGLLQYAARALRLAASMAVERGDFATARKDAVAAARILQQLGLHAVLGSAEDAQLSEREWDVVKLAVQGLGNKEIAGKLHLSVRTVEGHLRRSYAKVGVRNRAELMVTVAVDVPGQNTIDDPEDPPSNPPPPPKPQFLQEMGAKTYRN